MESKLVSIIVPAYNSDKWIERCIESLMAQTYKNIEIILVNDGSLDNTSKIIWEYAHSHKCIKALDIEHGGQSKARNIGIESASGDYVCFVDSDDYVDPSYCFELVKALKDADMSICGVKTYLYEEFFDDNKVEKEIEVDKSQLIKKILKLEDFSHIVANKLFKKDFLIHNNIRFHEGRLYEDMIFAYETALCCEKVHFIDKSLYFYMTRENSTFTTFTSKRIEDYLFAIKTVHQQILDSVIFNEIREEYIDYLNFNALHAIRLFVSDENPDVSIYQCKMKEILNLIWEVKNIKVRI